jgi:hypothetical protein
MPLHRRIASLAVGTILLCFTLLADARLVRFDIERREVVADGRSFGSVGQYEKLTGRAWFEADPSDVRNARVTDIGNAVLNDAGHVAFSADMVILKPVDMAKAAGTLFLEVNNRGRKIAFGRLHDTSSAANMNDPMSQDDFGNGFLLDRGYVVAWIGWGADIAPGDHRLTVDFPIAQDEQGQPLTERILVEFGDRQFNGEAPTTLPLSGSPAFRSFPAVTTRKDAAEAELWMADSDSPRPDGPEIPPGQRVSDDRWAFAHCPDGWPGTPSETDICLRDGFRNDRNYRLFYRASHSPVMGLGYLTTRDFVAWLRHGITDDSGHANPVAGLKNVLCLGISSSGMYLRDFLYQGFNEDEQGRRVCDGMHVHVAGVQKLFLNYRFAQPNPFSQQHRDRHVPDTNFPHQYGVRGDPRTRVPDGIMKRPSTDPKLIHSDSSNEYWQFRASLTGTTEGGRMDLGENPRVRRYLLSSLQHGSFQGDTPHRGIADRQCERRSNPVHPGPLLRALTVALDEWVTAGTPPPDTRVPKVADGTLVPPEALDLPAIPGLTYRARFNGSGERDFGPRVRGNAGVIDHLLPFTVYPHRVLVPQVDGIIGHEIAGIRHPSVDVPIATYLGWNTRTSEFGGDDLCDLLGSMIPLPRSVEDAAERNDPRQSLKSLYGDHAGYVRRFTASVRSLESERLLLPEDASALIREAQESKVLR